MKEKEVKQIIRNMDFHLLRIMRQNPYKAKVHFNKEGNPQCGMKVNTKQIWRLTNKKMKVTCRLCLKGNGRVY